MKNSSMAVLGMDLYITGARRKWINGAVDLCLPYLNSDCKYGGATLAWDPMGTLALPYVTAYSNSICGGKLLAVGDEEGLVTIMNTEHQLPTFLSHFRPNAQWIAHQNAIFDLQWLMGDGMMATASGDKTVAIWDTCSAQLVSSLKAHTGSIRTISASQITPSVLASGGRDGCVMLWDTRCSELSQTIRGHVRFRPVQALRDAHSRQNSMPRSTRKVPPMQSSTSVTSVLFLCQDTILASAGAADGTVKYWDLRKMTKPTVELQTPKSVASVELYKLESLARKSQDVYRDHGVSCLAIDYTGSKLMVSACNGVHYMYDALRPHLNPLQQYTGHTMESFYIKSTFSPDGSHFLSGSSDHNAYIWKVDGKDERPLVLQGHEGEVSGVAWCPTDMTQVATCGDNAQVRIWKVDRASDHPRLERKESEAVSTAIQNMECSVSEDKENVTPEVAESRTKSLPDHRPPLQPVTSTPAHQKDGNASSTPYVLSQKKWRQKSIFAFMTPTSNTVTPLSSLKEHGKFNTCSKNCPFVEGTVSSVSITKHGSQKDLSSIDLESRKRSRSAVGCLQSPLPQTCPLSSSVQKDPSVRAKLHQNAASDAHLEADDGISNQKRHCLDPLVALKEEDEYSNRFSERSGDVRAPLEDEGKLHWDENSVNESKDPDMNSIKIPPTIRPQPSLTAHRPDKSDSCHVMNGPLSCMLQTPLTESNRIQPRQTYRKAEGDLLQKRHMGAKENRPPEKLL